MATKRLRPNGARQYIIKRKGLLPKPLYLAFDDEAQGDRYVAALEAQLDAGVLPADPDAVAPKYALISDVIRAYLANSDVPDSDRRNLSVLHGRIGGTKLRAINYPWVETWVGSLKQQYHLSPSTIRHQVGALARCFDWAGRRHVTELLVNPLRMLPKRVDADRKLTHRGCAQRAGPGGPRRAIAVRGGLQLDPVGPIAPPILPS